jgi:hypothetical protein
MTLIMKIITLALFLFITHAHAEDFDRQEYVVDLKTNKYLHVCENDADHLMLKEVCSKGWPPIERKRDEIIREVTVNDGVKKNDMVMIRVRKPDDKVVWALTKVSAVYENGRVNVMEWYDKRFGYSRGTYHYTTNLKDISRPIASHLKSESEVCAKEDFDVFYSEDNERKFSIKKGDKFSLFDSYANQYSTVSFKDPSFVDRLQGYGMEGKLPVPTDKLEKCDQVVTDVKVSDDSRGSKKVEDNSTPDKVIDSSVSR